MPTTEVSIVTRRALRAARPFGRAVFGYYYHPSPIVFAQNTLYTKHKNFRYYG